MPRTTKPTRPFITATYQAWRLIFKGSTASQVAQKTGLPMKDILRYFELAGRRHDPPNLPSEPPSPAFQPADLHPGSLPPILPTDPWHPHRQGRSACHWCTLRKGWVKQRVAPGKYEIVYSVDRARVEP